MGLLDKLKKKTQPNERKIVQVIQTKPKKFWGYCYNEAFHVGCNGATVYVYDKDYRELARFKDVPYAYRAKFMPNSNILAVKSTAGYLAFYNLDTLSLIKKINVCEVGSQDDGFAFTPDGKYFINIERPFSTTHSRVQIYQTSDFKPYKIFEFHNDKIEIRSVEFGSDKKCYVLGFVRNDEGVYDYGFAGELTAKGIAGMKKIESDYYHYVQKFKYWEDCGFTERRKENYIASTDNAGIEYIALKNLCKNN